MNSQKKVVIFIDSGDTLVDESTEIYLEGTPGLVEYAKMREGAVEMIKTLKKMGHKVVMVADGLSQSFVNVHTYHGIYDEFDGHIFSDDLGVRKPDAKMFLKALEAVNLSVDDCNRILMVGNNLERDILGANKLGMKSVHMTWTKRYRQQPIEEMEIPDYTIVEPMELIDLVIKIEEELSNN